MKRGEHGVRSTSHIWCGTVVLCVSVRKATEKEDTTQITTVLIKLEGIADGIAEIKADMKNVKNDIRQLYERLAKVEASASSAHKRLDGIKEEH